MAFLGCVLVVFLDLALRPFLPAALGLRAAPPDLPLLAALYIGYRARDAGALVYAPLLGAMKDCFSDWPVGHFAFLFGFCALAAHRMSPYFARQAGLAQAAGSLLCGLLLAVASLLLAVVAGRRGAGAGLPPALFGAVTSALAAPLFFALLDRTRLFRALLARGAYRFGE
ncbi:MAG: hypothetical protein ACT4PV_08795 [Planctomycetaceae bacterium]